MRPQAHPAGPRRGGTAASRPPPPLQQAREAAVSRLTVRVEEDTKLGVGEKVEGKKKRPKKKKVKKNRAEAWAQQAMLDEKRKKEEDDKETPKKCRDLIKTVRTLTGGDDPHRR